MSIKLVFKPMLLAVFLLNTMLFAGSYDWCFIQNQGQENNNVNFSHAIPNGTLFLEDDKLTYHLYDTQAYQEAFEHHNTSALIQNHAFEVEFLQANSNIIKEQNDQTAQYFNFFRGDNPSKWASEIKGYHTVKYLDLYDGIDFVMYDYNQVLKYDFIVKKGANPDNIQLKYNGLDHVYIDAEGQLHLKNSVQDIIEAKPIVYQNINGSKKFIEAKYILTGNTVLYEFPNGYNTEYDLIVDPTLIFSSYSGSTNLYSANCSAYDQAGNLYSAGISPFANTFPTTVGAYQTTTVGFGALGAVQKFSPNGALLYATYLGGDNDYPLDITINNDSNLVLAFNTNGSFPITTGTYDQNFNGGGWDYAVAILSNNGTNLLASTYIGGTGTEGAGNSESYSMGLFIDNANNILLTGSSASIDFPTTTGVLQPVMNGIEDGIIAKFNANLTNLDWATYLGGNNTDIVNSIKIAPNNDIYVVGNTLSNNFPATVGSINGGPLGGRDGFVARINPNGTNLIASSFLGTNTNDRAKFIEVNDANEIFVAGTTIGNYPTSAGVFSSPSDNNMFVHKMSTDLLTTIYSTAIGCANTSQPEIYMTAFGIDYCDKVYFTGASTGNNFPLTANAYTAAEKGLYLCVLEPNATALNYGSYFGGDVNGQHFHPCSKSKYNREGILFHTECTFATNYPLLNGVANTAGGLTDGASFIFDFEFNIPLTQVDLGMDVTLCSFPFNIDAQLANNINVEYLWSTAETTSNIDINSPGSYSVKVFNSCDTIYDTIQISGIAIVPNYTSDITDICEGGQVIFTDNTPTVANQTWLWEFGDGQTSTLQNPTIEFSSPGKFSVSLTVESGACSASYSSTDSISVNPTPVANFGFTPDVLTTETTEATFVNTSSSDNNEVYIWTFGSTNLGTSIKNNPKFNFPDDGDKTYPVTLKVTNSFDCTSEITKFIEVQEIVTFYVPNAFTPGDKGVNSDFTPIMTSGFDPYQFHLLVFNRWGEIMFESFNHTIGWDGIYDKDFAQDGVYIWRIEFKESAFDKTHTQTGHVTLLR